MDKEKFLVYWFDYKHKSTVFPIYKELKRRGFDVESMQFNNVINEEIINKFKKASVLITSSDNCPLPYDLGFTNRIVWTWHGAGNIFTSEGSGFCHSSFFKNHKLNLMIGSIDYDYFSKEMKNLKIVGYPKFDNIPNLKLPLPCKKTILLTEGIYLGDKEGYYWEMVKKIVGLSEKLHFNLLIRPYDANNKRHNEFITDKIKILDDLDDISPYYKLADLVISDIKSTPIYEAIGMNKPILFFRFMKYLSLCVTGPLNEPVGLEITLENVEEVINRTFENPNEFEKQRLFWKDKIYYKLDDKASERAVDAIEEILK